MLKLIEGLPPHVMAIEAVGRVTHRDYQSILIPKAEAMLAQGPIDMLYLLGDDFSGFELEALWDDATFGARHWRGFSRIAVVTDHAWIRAAVSMFNPFVPGEVRLFKLSDLPAAKTWTAAGRAPRE
jgi:hypothetical protein